MERVNGIMAHFFQCFQRHIFLDGTLMISMISNNHDIFFLFEMYGDTNMMLQKKTLKIYRLFWNVKPLIEIEILKQVDLFKSSNRKVTHVSDATQFRICFLLNIYSNSNKD